MNNILKQLYSIEIGSFDACINCSVCESNETLLLLPEEFEYILQKNNYINLKSCFIKAHGFYIHPDGVRCKFLDHNNKCQIYSDRPFDCRSYPILPKFVQHTTHFYLTKNSCKLTKTIDLDSINRIIKCWQLIVPHLDLNWKILYNTLNEKSYGKYID